MTAKLITIPKRVVIVLLAASYALAFLITPYWRSVESVSGMTLILALTIFVGALWLAFLGSDVQIRIDSNRWGFLLILLVISIALNFKPLASVIPWRGDEDYFISNTLSLASSISTKWLLVLFAAFFLIGLPGMAKNELDDTRWNTSLIGHHSIYMDSKSFRWNQGYRFISLSLPQLLVFCRPPQVGIAFPR